MKVKEAAAQKVEEMERRFEEKGLGPVVGVDRSVEETTTPDHVGAKGDAAVGKIDMKDQTLVTPNVQVESIDSSSSSSVSSSPLPSSPSLSPPHEVRSGNAGPTLASEREGEDAPQYGVSDSDPSSGRQEGDALAAAKLRPVDSSSSSSSSGIDGPATEHAAEAQRNEGMPSSELLGTQAIRNDKGTQTMEDKARPPRPMATGKGGKGSRSHQ